MKVHAVSLGFKSRRIQDKTDNIYPFLYSSENPSSDRKLKTFGITTAVLALSAVCLTLFNLKRAKKLPQDIADIPNMEKGLNKLKQFHKTTEDIKTKFIYPLKSAALGEEDNKKLKSGLIFINENNNQTQQVISALSEHLEELEINVVNINKFPKRNQAVKEVFMEVERAEKLYSQEGKYTLINLGNLENLTSLKAVKSQKSKIEQLLENISSNEYKGVVWLAESSNIEGLPLFFNNLPVMITKIVD